MKTFLAGALLSLSLISPVIAWAGEPTPEQLDQARQLFEQGQEAYNNGQYGVALGFYTQAYELAKKPTILFNIGQCYRKLGKPQEASDSYKKFIKDDPQTQYLGEVEYKIAELAEELKNPTEALSYYERYLQHKVADDPNEAKAKERIDAIKKDLEANGPEDPPTEGGLMKQPLAKAAIGSAAGGIALWSISTAFLGNKLFSIDGICRQRAGDGDPDNNCGGEGANLPKAPLAVAALAGDALFLVATPALLYLANKKNKQGSSETVAKKSNTALRLIPTTTGGFVTFSFTPQP
jgi:tetratricopeptide (TPR) repeat protein